MMIVKTLSVQSSVLHGDMGYITFAQLSLRGTRLCERQECKEANTSEVMILSCPNVDLICISDLSSLTVCLNLLICKLAFI